VSEKRLVSNAPGGVGWNSCEKKQGNSRKENKRKEGTAFYYLREEGGVGMKEGGTKTWNLIGSKNKTGSCIGRGAIENSRGSRVEKRIWVERSRKKNRRQRCCEKGIY